MAHAWTAASDVRQRASLGVLFSYGFRPFFLGAAVYAVAIMAVWLAWLGSQAQWGVAWELPVTGSPFAWHAHEMVFGFAVAAIAGFLLTAIPNWTGALPLSGLPLALLFLAWLAGRAVMAVSGLLAPAFVAIVDLAFLPLLGSFAAVSLFVRPAPRNLVFLAVIAAFTAANVVYHLVTAGIIGVHFTGGSERNIFYGNSFIGNETQVKYTGLRLYEWSKDGRGNYWSDNPAFDLDGDGIADTAYRPNTLIDWVLWKYPLVKLLLSSPAMETLRYVQQQFPTLYPGGAIDSFPLMTPGAVPVVLPKEVDLTPAPRDPAQEGSALRTMM